MPRHGSLPPLLLFISAGYYYTPCISEAIADIIALPSPTSITVIVATVSDDIAISFLPYVLLFT